MPPTSSPSNGLQALQRIFSERGELLRYEIGQRLCEGQFIPGQVLLIERGSARLLGEQEGRLSTLAKLEAGEFIGAASLLRGAPCEEVRAASELVAYQLSDNDFLDLIRDNPAAASCRSHLWTAELAALLSTLLHQTPKQTRTLNSWLQELMPQAQLLDASDDTAVQNAFNTNQRLFLGGEPAEPGHGEMGQEFRNVKDISALPGGLHQLPLRLIALPDSAIQELNLEATAELVCAEVVGTIPQQTKPLTKPFLQHLQGHQSVALTATVLRTRTSLSAGKDRCRKPSPASRCWPS